MKVGSLSKPVEAGLKNIDSGMGSIVLSSMEHIGRLVRMSVSGYIG